VAGPAGFQFAVLSGGVRLPAIPVAETTPVETAPLAAVSPAPAPVIAPVRKRYVAPVYPRKQTRH
jgi:hypothetical protein